MKEIERLSEIERLLEIELRILDQLEKTREMLRIALEDLKKEGSL